MSVIRKFWADRSGSYAMIMGVVAVPVLLGIGFAVDYSRAVNAKRHAQEIADSTVLALAASGEESYVKLSKMAQDYIAANAQANILENVSLSQLVKLGDAITVSIKGDTPTTFMSIANVASLDVAASASADRAVTGKVELGLVLDNTFSMIEADAKGVKKIDALKKAATTLVNELMSNPKADVRISLVPYADYVNVGVGNRNKKWLDVDKDKTTGSEKKCEKKTTKTVCDKAPTYACTKVIDGVSQAATCGGGDIAGTCRTETVKEYDSCTGGYSNYTWYGCVASRKLSKLKLNDDDKLVPYPGYVATSRGCPTPIQPLSNDKASILADIAAMKESNGGYKPLTYIPSGLLWGLNVLSPGEPFDEGSDYDLVNKSPRKVIVLMTDGENTLRYNNNILSKDSTDGKVLAVPVDLNGLFTLLGALQVAVTNSDTLTMCADIKKKNIEVFSIALAVDSSQGKLILETCATDKDHYFDASDSDGLNAAFSGVAKSLSAIRLTR